MPHRLERLNSEIRHELADLLRKEVKDPSLSGMISITSVEIAADLKYAKVFVSTLGGVQEKEAVLKALSRASGFLRGELARNMRMRNTPELDFQWDDSIEHGAHILELMDKVRPEGGYAPDQIPPIETKS